VDLGVTDNTYTMLSFSRRGGTYRVRLHHMFLAAPGDLVELLGRYIKGDHRQALIHA
jgi:hypothetical protein